MNYLVSFQSVQLAFYGQFSIGANSYGAISIALELLYAQAQGYYNNIPSFALQIIGLAGFGQGLGIIIGAITFRMVFMLMPKIGVIPK